MVKENTQSATQPVKTAIQLASEFVLPVRGGSHLFNGDIKEGALHAIAGLAAGALLGPLGVVLVGANSFSRATTGRHLHEHLDSSGTKSA